MVFPWSKNVSYSDAKKMGRIVAFTVLSSEFWKVDKIISYFTLLF
jgi:hypothetical protein